MTELPGGKMDYIIRELSRIAGVKPEEIAPKPEPKQKKQKRATRPRTMRAKSKIRQKMAARSNRINRVR